MYSTKPCEQEFAATGRRSYSYFLTSKSSFAHPTLTHQFQVRWPWPAQPSANAGNAVGGSSTSRGRKAAGSPVKHEQPAAAVATGDDRPLFEVARRRYNRPTTVLSLTADPHAPADAHGTPQYDDRHTQRIAMLLSSGHRFYLPLVPTAVDEARGSSAAVDARGERVPQQYWRTACKASPSPSKGASPTVNTELVIGELAAVEWVMEQWERQLRSQGRLSSQATTRDGGVSPFSSRIDLSAAASTEATGSEVRDAIPVGEDVEAGVAGDCVHPYWARSSPRASHLPVHSFLMHSVPYKTVWLYAVRECLLVSLPCEERVVSLKVPYPRSLAERDGATVPGHTIGQCEPVPLRAAHAFHLPRGTVPLDIVEIPQRPFVAIGTYEHGVLICWLNVATGAVESIAQSIALNGVGSAIFPVSKLAAVFPPLWTFSHNLNWPSLSGVGHANSPEAGAFPWSTKARFLSSLGDGALVCSSPYDVQTVVIKNLASGASSSAVFENFCTGKQQDPLLAVGSCCDFDVGVLCLTTQGLLTRLQAFPDDVARGELPENPLQRPRVDALNKGGQGLPSTRTKKPAEEDATNSDGGTEEGRTDLALELVDRHGKTSHSLVSERLHPIVLRTSPTGRAIRFYRLGDTAPIYQLKGPKANRLDGVSIQHFTLAATFENEVVLLDRVLTIYKALSRHKLLPCPSQNGVAKGVAEDTVKREESDVEEGADYAESPLARDRLEDLCAGLVFLCAGHQWMTVAAAHHGNSVSILTYRSSVKEVGLLKRCYQK